MYYMYNVQYTQYHQWSLLYIDGNAWLLQDASFEKMGALMAANDGRLLGMYDEMSSFLGKLNLCRGRGMCDWHELAVFLELYNANAWSRSTGIYLCKRVCNSLNFIRASAVSPLLWIPQPHNCVYVYLISTCKPDTNPMQTLRLAHIKFESNSIIHYSGHRSACAP